MNILEAAEKVGAKCEINAFEDGAHRLVFKHATPHKALKELLTLLPELSKSGDSNYPLLAFGTVKGADMFIEFEKETK